MFKGSYSLFPSPFIFKVKVSTFPEFGKSRKYNIWFLKYCQYYYCYSYDMMKGWGPAQLSTGPLSPFPKKVEGKSLKQPIITLLEIQIQIKCFWGKKHHCHPYHYHNYDCCHHHCRHYNKLPHHHQKLSAPLVPTLFKVFGGEENTL